MKIQSIQPGQTTFNSRFAKTSTLQKAFVDLECSPASEMVDRRNFLHAVSSIINDGKKDIIKVKDTDKDTTVLTVNGKVESILSEYGFESSRTQNAIVSYAEKEKGFKKLQSDTESLTEEEKQAIQAGLEDYSSLDKVYDKDGSLTGKAHFYLDEYISDALYNLQKLIFGKDAM